MQVMQGYHMAQWQVLAAILIPLESSCMLTHPCGTGLASLDSTERWPEANTGQDCYAAFRVLLPQCPSLSKAACSCTDSFDPESWGVLSDNSQLLLRTLLSCVRAPQVRQIPSPRSWAPEYCLKTGLSQRHFSPPVKSCTGCTHKLLRPKNSEAFLDRTKWLVLYSICAPVASAQAILLICLFTCLFKTMQAEPCDICTRIC